MKNKNLGITFILIFVIILFLVAVYPNSSPNFYDYNNINIKESNISPNESLHKIIDVSPDINITLLQISFNDNKKEYVFNKKLDYNNRWISISGDWRYTEKYAFQTKTITRATSYLEAFPWSNYSVEIEGYFVEKGGDPLIMLSARFLDGNNFYELLVSPGGYGKLIKIIGGEEIALYTTYSLKPSNNRKLKLIIIGSDIIAYVDDIPFVEVKDASIDKGTIAVKSHYSKVKFYNIFVKRVTKDLINGSYNFHIFVKGLSNVTLSPAFVKKDNNPSGNPNYIDIYGLKIINYTSLNNNISEFNDLLSFTITDDLIRPPDIIYFPTEPYNRTFTIRLVAKGWDEQKQEWVFKEFMSPEFTWEDVVEGRTIMADGSRQ